MTFGLKTNHTLSQRNKGKKCSFMVLGVAVAKATKFPTSEDTEVRSIETFHWLSPGSLPRAELSPGQEGSFLPPVEVAMQPHFLAERQGGKVLLFLLESFVCAE